MTLRSIAYLKEKFETGDVPTQADFVDLIDSLLHYTQKAASNGLVFKEGTFIKADTIKAGVIDPAKVTISAITYSSSIAGMLLNTEGMIKSGDSVTVTTWAPFLFLISCSAAFISLIKLSVSCGAVFCQ